MKTAFVYSGQGAQYIGMGHDMFLEYQIVRDTFQEASDLLHYDMTKLCFEKNEQLDQTVYTQPAILTVSTALHRVVAAEGFQPDIVAGLSLGEYSALVASNALSFSEGIELVAQRGRFMTEAVPAGVGKMVAVGNTSRKVIEQACQKASQYGVVVPANYNTPVQIVIGGEADAVDRACELLKAAGVKRLIPLNVSGPFHTPLLKSASVKLAEALEQISFQPMTIPVISNTTAEVMPQDKVKSLLTQQVMTAVRWEDSINTMIHLGVEQIVEIGPGKVLSGFIRKINKEMLTSRVEDIQTFSETISLLKN